MVFFGDQYNKSLTDGLAVKLGCQVNFPGVVVFPDSERRVRINADVVEKDVVFVKTSSVTPNFDSFILETAFLIDSIKRSGADKIMGIIPYIPYSRGDHVFRSGEGVPLEVVIRLFENAGLDRIVFVDPHTIKMPEMFKIEVVNASALPIFAQKIREIGFDKDNAVIVSPDMGGLRRMEQLSEMLDHLSFTSIEKDRDYETGSIKAAGIHGDVKKTCFIIDDIISSGRTIVQAVEKLNEGGAEDIYVFATHPILSENATNMIQESKVKKVFVTDAIPVGQNKSFEKLEVLSLADLIINSLKN